MRCFRATWLALVLALTGLAPGAAGQPALSLREAVAKALAANPLLAAGSQRIEASEGLRRQAGLRPNPMLVLQTENSRPNGPFRFWNDTDNFAYLQQTFETAGKREWRVAVAAADLRRAELERELTGRSIAGKVKLAYWAAAGSQRAHELLEENSRTFRQIVDYHEVRVKEGAMAEADLLRVRLEGERLAIAAGTALLESERARILLFREMAATEFPAVRLAEPLDQDRPLPPNADAAYAIEQRPEARLARQAVEQARARLRLEQASARPNLDVLFGYKRAAPGFDTVVGGVQVDLPFTNRNQGNISAATAEVRAAESSLAAAEALIKAEVAGALREYEIRRRQAGGVLRSMRDQAAETSRIAEAAYREGGTDLLRLLDAERLRLDTQLLYYRALAEFQQSASQVEIALGMAP